MLICVKLASAYLERLSKRVFTNRNLSTPFVSQLPYASCLWGMDTVLSSHRSPSHLASLNYSARALLVQCTPSRDPQLGRHKMSGDHAAQKATRMTWSRDKLPGNRFPRRLLYSELPYGRCSMGQKSSCRIPYAWLEGFARDRGEWRVAGAKRVRRPQ